MQVSLKVVGGKNDGREIKIAVPEFIIGRGETAHLKPTSDLVSRAHCAIRVQDGGVVIEDLKSRNGTFVNGDKLEGCHQAKVGDRLRVGRLQFEVMIDHVAAGNKKPRVQGVVEAAARTAGSGSPRASIEDSIAGWLVEEEDEPNTDERSYLKTSDTVQMKLEDTMAITGATSDTDSSGSIEDSSEETMIETPSSKKKKKKEKKEYGKLPKVPKAAHGSSTSAADDVLRKFFNRR